jgi:Trk-type K+ transport system membrane component
VLKLYISTVIASNLSFIVWVALLIIDVKLSKIKLSKNEKPAPIGGVISKLIVVLVFNFIPLLNVIWSLTMWANYSKSFNEIVKEGETNA